MWARHRRLGRGPAASDWVWEDLAPLERRTRKGAVALATVARELASRPARSPAQAEFLHLYREFGGLADERFEPLRAMEKLYRVLRW